jgi:3-hydroxy acid dehydrogenase/malonic semialdehyde reductase
MIAMITGATSGFGRAIALSFAGHGWDVIITGRRTERLNELAGQIRDEHATKVLSLAFDIRRQAEVKAAVDSIPDEWRAVDVLVNNAGLAAGLSTVQQGELSDWEDMIDTNVKGLLYISRMVIPWMVARSKGHIVNMGSMAGKEAYPYGNVYCATKHAVDALSKSMRIDLLAHGIKVTAIHPGAAETEFSIVRFKGDTERAAKVYEGINPLTAEDIADIVWFAVSRPAHVVLNEILVTPLAQANTAYFHREGMK